MVIYFIELPQLSNSFHLLYVSVPRPMCLEAMGTVHEEPCANGPVVCMDGEPFSLVELWTRIAPLLYLSPWNYVSTKVDDSFKLYYGHLAIEDV